MIEITVEDAVPSLNRLLRLHWAQRRKLTKKWQWLLFTEVYRLGGPMAVFQEGKLAVRITRFYRRVPLDEDNLAGSAKFVLDAMKVSRLIADDSPAHIALTCAQTQGSPRTIIQVSPYNASVPTTGSPDEPPPSLC